MSDQRFTYRGYHVKYNPKPIPTAACDWDWVHDDYDGEGDPRSGVAASREAAMAAIDENILEQEE